MDKVRTNDLYLNVRVDEIELGENIRGPFVGDTTDLQESIKQSGVEDPLWIRPVVDLDEVDDAPSAYALIEGRRRLTAAKAIGLEEVPCLLKMVGEEEAIDLMLTANMGKKQPPIVLDKEGRVVGGLCWAFYRQVQAGKRIIDIAVSSGIRPDVVGAYVALHGDSIEMKRAVASGKMGITVYSLCKHQEIEFKSYLLTKKKLSGRVVRKEIKDWPITKARLARERAVDAAVSENGGEKPKIKPEPAPNNFPTAGLLNQAWASVSLARDREFEPTDIFILQRIHALIEDLLLEYGGLETENGKDR